VSGTVSRIQYISYFIYTLKQFYDTAYIHTNTFYPAARTSSVINLEVVAPRYLGLITAVADLTIGCAMASITVSDFVLRVSVLRFEPFRGELNLLNKICDKKIK
jgi:hypothetical protein